MGGHLRRECLQQTKYLGLFQELDRKGSLRSVRDEAVDAMTDAVRDLELCVSDDEHIIALARVARVRLLCTNDTDLHVDFKNRKLLDPPGNVYQKQSHRGLIGRYCKCKHKTPSR